MRQVKGGGKNQKGWCNSWNNKSCEVQKNEEEKGRKEPFLIMKYCCQFDKNGVLQPKEEKFVQKQ